MTSSRKKKVPYLKKGEQNNIKILGKIMRRSEVENLTRDKIIIAYYRIVADYFSGIYKPRKPKISLYTMHRDYYCGLILTMFKFFEEHKEEYPLELSKINEKFGDSNETNT